MIRIRGSFLKGSVARRGGCLSRENAEEDSISLDFSMPVEIYFFQRYRLSSIPPDLKRCLVSLSGYDICSPALSHPGIISI
jgi:hypothetical protein